MGAQQLLLRQRGAPVRITDRAVGQSDVAVAPATASATATYALLNTGVLRLNGVTDVTGEWLIPPTASASDYEARFTHLGGDVPSGVTYGVWLNSGTTRGFSLTATRTTNGTTSLAGNVRVEIGRAGLNTAEVTADIAIQADAERTP